MSIKAAKASFEEYWRPVWTPLLVLAFPVLPFFWSYHVRLEDAKLSFGYSTRWTSVSFSVEDIASVRILEKIQALREFGGWGIRINSEGTISYIAESGTGIEITTTDGTKRIFNVRDAKRLARLLQPSKLESASEF
ncbi:Hypothetical Protein FCC1311_007572 [Hondaea fermentalgiana]|uniref:PH domain-containing protein n=1 Tax=Hondaea fermentalgiana TaxID=2315210 RepID=A0A2R5G432_9STRA|nr:Hypothetical Protein FCC1311_007572 [Hondaea fermentalgiana]|eukprot:GBG24538.1 Hypothetical Protein FCC1311_007572 [Hondaea fermentalgiana]